MSKDISIEKPRQRTSNRTLTSEAIRGTLARRDERCARPSATTNATIPQRHAAALEHDVQCTQLAHEFAALLVRQRVAAIHARQHATWRGGGVFVGAQRRQPLFEVVGAVRRREHAAPRRLVALERVEQRARIVAVDCRAHHVGGDQPRAVVGIERIDERRVELVRFGHVARVDELD